MKVEENKVILEEHEVSRQCPRDVRWAAKMVQLYGVKTEPKGRLGELSRCLEVLKEAGYEVEVRPAEKSPAEAPEASEE